MTVLQQAAYSAIAASPKYKEAVQNTVARIREVGTKYAVSMSWGKDSVVMLDLVIKALGHATAIHGRYSDNEETPDAPDVRDKFLARYPGKVTYAEVAIPGAWEYSEANGSLLIAAETPEQRKILKQSKELFVKALEDAATYHGCEGMMIGMAAHESRARRYNISQRGDLYRAKNRLPTFLPLAKWSSEYVVAYKVANDLPWLRIYELSGTPERTRSDICFGGGAGQIIHNRGGWQEWKAAYPEFYAAWDAKWGLRRFEC